MACIGNTDLWYRALGSRLFQTVERAARRTGEPIGIDRDPGRRRVTSRQSGLLKPPVAGDSDRTATGNDRTPEASLCLGELEPGHVPVVHGSIGPVGKTSHHFQGTAVDI